MGNLTFEKILSAIQCGSQQYEFKRSILYEYVYYVKGIVFQVYGVAVYNFDNN